MTVTILPGTAIWLSTLGLGDFTTVETVERMAWVASILRHVRDDDDTFPHGKWGTIQSIEEQVQRAARRVGEAL